MLSANFNASSFHKITFCSAMVVLLGTFCAGQTKTPKYDFATETKMAGVIEDLKFPPQGHEKDIAHLVMKYGDQMVDIYLCPKSFMDEMGVIFKKGDEIAFTGSKVKQGEEEMMLARQIVKGDDTLTLRDGKGKPVWGP